MTEHDRLSREELVAAILAAAERQVHRSDDSVSVSEAERIADDVGVGAADFHAALRDLRGGHSTQVGLLGPPSTVSVTEFARPGVTAHEAAQMLARGQVVLGFAGGSIEAAGDAVWRLAGSKGAVLHVIAGATDTTLAASENRRLTKCVAILGGGLVGLYGGYLIIASVVSGVVSHLGDPYNAVVVANLAGLVGSVASAFALGRAIWSAAARRHERHLKAAVDAMRRVLADSERGSYNARGSEV